MRSGRKVVTAGLAIATSVGLTVPTAHADNDNTLIPNDSRLNKGVVSDVYALQHQAGCSNDLTINRQLQLAAQWHTDDVLNNRALDGDIGTDGSTAQDRANAAGFRGRVAETIAIVPTLAINNIQIINQWYYDPAAYAIMSDCTNTQMGVWSENSLDRSVLVAVYGRA